MSDFEEDETRRAREAEERIRAARERAAARGVAPRRTGEVNDPVPSGPATGGFGGGGGSYGTGAGEGRTPYGTGARTTGPVSGLDPDGRPDIRRAHQSKSGGIMAVLALAGIVAVGYYAFAHKRNDKKEMKVYSVSDFTGIIELSKLETGVLKVDAFLLPNADTRPGSNCREPWARMVQTLATEGYTEVVLHDYGGTAICMWDDTKAWPQP